MQIRSCKNLKKLIFGGGIESIGTYAFSGCSKLEDVYCYAKRYPKTERNAFQDSYLDYVTLHVPTQSVTQYKAHEVWGQFMEVVPLTQDEEELRPDPVLSFLQADNGSISIQVPRGSVYTFTITPNNGWEIHSVTFNDIDVTNLLGEGNSFATPAITANATLSVVYELDDVDDVGSVSESDMKIQGTAMGVRVTGANKDDVIRIYGTDGSLHHSVKVKDDVVDLPLDKANVYIVKVGTRTMKLSH